MARCFWNTLPNVYSKKLFMKHFYKILIQEFTISIQNPFHVFLALESSTCLQATNPAHMIISHLPYCCFKKISWDTLLITQPRAYLTDSSRTILDSFLCITFVKSDFIYIFVSILPYISLLFFDIFVYFLQQ